MSTQTSHNDHTVTLELSLEDLRVLIGGLICQSSDVTATLGLLEDNARMLDLLLQLEQGIIRYLNETQAEEDQVRQYGEI